MPIYLIVALWVISLIVSFFIGWVANARRTAHILATMNMDELAYLADRVQELREDD